MLALLPIALQALPFLTQLLAGDKGTQVLNTIGDIAKLVTGASTHEEAAAAIAADPKLAEQFIAKLAAETEQFKAAIADVADARNQTVELAKLGGASSVMAWGAAVISTIVTIAFAGITLTLIFMGKALPQGVDTIVTLLTGSLATAFGQVTSYWLGSSSSSKDKDALIGQALNKQAPDTGLVGKIAAAVKKK